MDKTALDAYDVLPAPFDIREELAKIGYTPMPFVVRSKRPPTTAAAKSLVVALQLRRLRRSGRFLQGSRVQRNAQPRRDHGRIRRLPPGDHPRRVAGSAARPTSSTTITPCNRCASSMPTTTSKKRFTSPPANRWRSVSRHRKRVRRRRFQAAERVSAPEDHRPDTGHRTIPEGAVQKAASTLRKDLFSWMGELPPDAQHQQLTDWIAQRHVLPSGHIRASARQHLRGSQALTACRTGRCVTSSPAAARTGAQRRAQRRPLPGRCHGGADPDRQSLRRWLWPRPCKPNNWSIPGMAYAVDDDGALIIEDGKLREVVRPIRAGASANASNTTTKGCRYGSSGRFLPIAMATSMTSPCATYGCFDQPVL